MYCRGISSRAVKHRKRINRQRERAWVAQTGRRRNRQPLRWAGMGGSDRRRTRCMLARPENPVLPRRRIITPMEHKHRNTHQRISKTRQMSSRGAMLQRVHLRAETRHNGRVRSREGRPRMVVIQVCWFRYRRRRRPHRRGCTPCPAACSSARPGRAARVWQEKRARRSVRRREVMAW